jgi:Ca2+-binding RTX toxin-like protein
LAGTAGDDTIQGLAGTDTMTGLAGNDTYYVDDAGDVVVEGAGEGVDTVRSSVDHSLAANVENLILTGTRDATGWGNELDNRIVGNAGHNLINGGPGNDILFGSAGSDMFYFRSKLNARTNIDRLPDFDATEDSIALVWLAFPAFVLGDGTLYPSQFRVGSTATTPSQRIVYNPVNGVLLYDPDGSGPIAAIPFAQLPPNLALTVNNFWIRPRTWL